MRSLVICKEPAEEVEVFGYDAFSVPRWGAILGLLNLEEALVGPSKDTGEKKFPLKLSRSH